MNLKYNIKEKLMYYRKKLNTPNFLIKVAIKLINKFYKLAMKTRSSNFDSNIKFY